MSAIDLEDNNKISKQQSEWIKSHTFKIEFRQSATRKADGNALTVNDYEMIAIQEFPESKGVEEDKDHAKNKTKQQNSSVVGAKDEDDGDLSKIISDPSIHGFFDFRSQKFLKKINVTSNGLTTGTKANLVRKSTISEVTSFNGQSSNPETV